MRRVASCRNSRAPSRAPARRGYSSGAQSVVNGKTVIFLETPQKKHIWLVGTAHISKKSAEEVKEVITAVKPDTVMVELDAARAAKLRGFKSLSSSSTAVSLFDPSAAAKKLGMFGMMPGIAGMMKLFYDYLRALGLDPGLEMRAAMETAELHNIPILLGDQDATITSRNLNNAFSLSDVMRLASSPGMQSSPHLKRLVEEITEATARSGGDPIKALFSERFIERLKDRDMVRTHMKALSSVAPKLFHALVGERDQFMVQKLLGDPGKRIVGVVGLGHLDGMEELLLREAGKPLPKREFILLP